MSSSDIMDLEAGGGAPVADIGDIAGGARRATVNRGVAGQAESGALAPNRRCRSWVMTLNFTDEALMPTAVGFIKQLFADSAVIKFAICQLERGESGTLHLQSYFVLKNPKAFAGVKRLFAPYQPHLEHARGNPKQNIDYCSKDEGRQDGPWEFGSYLLQYLF